ncbi:MAG: 3'-5' exonuclease, partial [Verrucomicrobiota bacterium]
DIKQSIYSWRGGDPTLFQDIFRHYNQNEERIVRRDLDVSWRSGHDVITTVNRIFGDRTVLEELGLPASALNRWQWNDHEVAPIHESLTGYTALLNPIPPAGEKLVEEDRFELVVAILKEMNPIERGIECAILVQTNQVGRRLVEYIRAQSQIPVMSEADVPIATDNALNRSVLSFLQLAAHPDDTFSWHHLLLTPFREIIENKGWSSQQLSSQVRQKVFERGFETVIREFIAQLESCSTVELDDFSRRRGEDLSLSARLFDRDGSRDIDEFLSFARNRTIREPDSRSAVQVMTIHKSKGLTFDAVILPDLGGNSLTTARNEIGAMKNEHREIDWVFDLPRKEIYNADETLRTFQAEREAEAAYENLCKLYVAMTRARCANYLITEPRGHTAKSNNFVKLLETALATTDPVEDRIGDTSVSMRFESDQITTSRSWFEDFDLEPVSEEPHPELKILPRNLARERPSRRTPSGSEKTVITASQIFSSRSAAARDFGTRVHQIFEEIEWWNEDLDLETLTTGGGDEDERRAIEQVRTCLEDAAVRAALSRPNENATVWREKSFEVVLGGEWLSGTFDRVTIETSEAGKVSRVSLIDFKTDRINSEEDHKKAIRTYTGQIETYRDVLSKLTGLAPEEIEANLIFTSSGNLTKM